MRTISQEEEQKEQSKRNMRTMRNHDEKKTLASVGAA